MPRFFTAAGSGKEIKSRFSRARMPIHGEKGSASPVSLPDEDVGDLARGGTGGTEQFHHCQVKPARKPPGIPGNLVLTGPPLFHRHQSARRVVKTRFQCQVFGRMDPNQRFIPPPPCPTPPNPPAVS